MTVKIKGKSKRRIPFELENSEGEIEEFSIRGIAGWAFIEIMDKFKTSEDATEAVKGEIAAAAELKQFFEEAIGDEEMYVRFRAFVRNPDNGFGIEELMDLLRQLAEEAAARPTVPSKPSRSGRAKTDTGSKETLSSVG